MAKSTIRIRFVFNQQAGYGADFKDRQSRQRFGTDFAGSIVENFTFRYADDMSKKIIKTITTEFQRDARKELVHMAALFRAHITGAPGTVNAPAGMLTSIADPEGERFTIKGSIPKWAGRTSDYLRDKQASHKHTRWFEYSGMLKSATNADTWISMFGPIRATFVRSRKLTEAANAVGSVRMADRSESGGRRIFRTPYGLNHMALAVGTVKVFALTNITPQMLPALASGDPGAMNKSLNPGLVGLISAQNEQLAYRLGGTRTDGAGHIYRPTLEPFLAFYLTSAIPAAIRNRLDLNGITSGRNSAGRTTGRR